MNNKYRTDSDLDVLRYADQEMLSVLVNYLTIDKDGKKRRTENLTGNSDFKRNTSNYQKVWKLIAAEIQHYGGDTIVNFVRNSGVVYKEILIDVCKKLSIKTNYKAETIEIEKALLAKIFQDSWDKMSQNERDDLRRELNIDKSLASSAALVAIISAIRLGGFGSYQVAMIVANSLSRAVLGRGVALAGNAGLAKGISAFSGPVGMVITAAMTIPAISGPAYRVTLPAVLQVAAIRQQFLNTDEDLF